MAGQGIQETEYTLHINCLHSNPILLDSLARQSLPVREGAATAADSRLLYTLNCVT